jgi:hypothetical protein
MQVLPANNQSAAYADMVVYNTATVTAQGMRIPNIQAAMSAASGVQP